jgi:MFS family permease
VALGGIFLVGAGVGAFQTLIMAAILRASAPEYFGRVVALTNVGWALNNLFGLVLGIVADATTERAALFGIGVLVKGAAVGGKTSDRGARDRIPRLTIRARPRADDAEVRTPRLRVLYQTLAYSRGDGSGCRCVWLMIERV